MQTNYSNHLNKGKPVSPEMCLLIEIGLCIQLREIENQKIIISYIHFLCIEPFSLKISIDCIMN